jgi:hypothetical protein
MELVSKWDQVLKNIRTLQAARKSRDSSLRTEYLDLIKLGTCFIIYKSDEGLAFAPSKFVGYVNNDVKWHNENKKKEGRHGARTNEALANIIGRRPESDQNSERAYCLFCRSLGFEPQQTGTAGHPRKYWNPDDLDLVPDAEAQIRNDPRLTDTEKEQLILARRGQGQFRKDLIAYWAKCCVSGCTLTSVLRASHIKPWSDSDNRERLDKFNGLLLSPNADALFEDGYISVADDGHLLTSLQLPEAAKKALLSGCGSKIQIEERHRPYLAYHREYRFRAVASD